MQNVLRRPSVFWPAELAERETLLQAQASIRAQQIHRSDEFGRSHREAKDAGRLDELSNDQADAQRYSISLSVRCNVDSHRRQAAADLGLTTGSALCFQDETAAWHQEDGLKAGEGIGAPLGGVCCLWSTAFWAHDLRISSLLSILALLVRKVTKQRG